MTAYAFPSRLIGPALPEMARYMSEPQGQRVLVLGGLATARPDVQAMCQALDIELITVNSHHELPFCLHHNRPLAVLSDLLPESLAMSAALRCIGAYDADLPVLMLARDAAVALGTIDAAGQLWGLTGLSRADLNVTSRSLLNFLAQAGRQQGVMRLLPVG